jgi:hypothetical protein
MKMNRTRLALVTLSAAALLVAGCFEPGLNSWQKGQLENRTSDDIGSQLEEFDAFSGGLVEVENSRGTWENCYAGWGGCERCYLLEGDGNSGTLSMELVTTQEAPACMQALTVNDVRYEYTIDDRQWGGSWTLASGTPGNDALWDVVWSGNHDATLIVTGSESYDGTYDSSFVMNQASGITDGDGNVSEWAVDYDYTGYLDRDWHVTASMDAEGDIAGDVVGSDGTTCLISGVQYDVVVDCE